MKYKKMSNSNSNSNGISFLGLLGIIFMVLKLTEVIDWNWWYVTLPLWGGLVLVLLILFILLIIKFFIRKVL